MWHNGSNHLYRGIGSSRVEIRSFKNHYASLKAEVLKSYLLDWQQSRNSHKIWLHYLAGLFKDSRWLLWNKGCVLFCFFTVSLVIHLSSFSYHYMWIKATGAVRVYPSRLWTDPQSTSAHSWVCVLGLQQVMEALEGNPSPELKWNLRSISLCYRKKTQFSPLTD